MIQDPLPDGELRASRHQVILAADELFYRSGFRAVGMDGLRTAAGVSLKRLYQLFDSKEAIILAVLDLRHQRWVDDVEQAITAASSPQGRLLAIYDFLIEWIDSDTFHGCVFINAFGELGAASPAVAERARHHKESFRRRISTLVAAAGLRADLADQLMLLAEGAQATAAITGDVELARHARRAAQTLIAADAGPSTTAQQGNAQHDGPARQPGTSAQNDSVD